MHDVALYRKYRPKSWEEVVGQDHIVKVLQSSIEGGKVSHAYLFVGSRGIGKTSVARIFAREIGVTENDLYEIDAASNRGIDDIKALREGVRVLPFDSKYKIYIIDEVHMLSKDAWGALLKTLEEPPKHVIFILATTEYHKVPDTIISRCQVFTFRKASDAALKNVLMSVAEKEGFEFDAGSAELLAILGDGSFRDALGTLQKVLNFSGSPGLPAQAGKGGKLKKIKREEIEKITGAPKSSLVNEYLTALVEADTEKGIAAIKKASEESLDMELFMKLIIEKVRLSLLMRYAPKTEIENLSGEDLSFVKELIKKDKEILRSSTLAILLEEYQNIGNAFVSELPLELALIRIIEKK